jgi:hypothetical protein
MQTKQSQYGKKSLAFFLNTFFLSKYPFSCIFKRDLDFEIDFEFKGELCELSNTHKYRMR